MERTSVRTINRKYLTLTGPVKWSQCFLRRSVLSQDAWTLSSSGCGYMRKEEETVEKRERGEKNKKSNTLLIKFSLAFLTRTVDTIAIRSTFYRNTLSLMTFPEECSMCYTNEAWPGPLMLFNTKCGAKHKPLQKLYWFQLHGVIHFLTRALKHPAAMGYIIIIRMERGFIRVKRSVR